MINFEDSLRKTFILEGGYADIEGDAGGKTKFGITQKVARHHGYHGEMRDLRKDMASRIYLTEYWDRVNGYKLKWQEVADQVFDHAVNCGVNAAGKVLQRAINKYGTTEKVKVDGKIGNGTIKELKKIKHKGYFLSRLIDERERHYDKIVFVKPHLYKFIKSWRRRPVALLLLEV